MVRSIEGRDGVVRGVTLLHKGHTIERLSSLFAPWKLEQRKRFCSLTRGGENELTQDLGDQNELQLRNLTVRRIAEQLHSEDG